MSSISSVVVNHQGINLTMKLLEHICTLRSRTALVVWFLRASSVQAPMQNYREAIAFLNRALHEYLRSSIMIAAAGWPVGTLASPTDTRR